MNRISGRLLALIAKRGMSYGELAEQTGIPKSALQRYATGETVKIPLERLEALAIALGVAPGYLLGWEKGISGGKISSERTTVRSLERIPIIGAVRAGWEGLAYEETDGSELADIRNPESYFYLRVTGDSMAPQIAAGDLALIHSQQMVENGQIAVILLQDDEATIKRVLFAGSNVILQPLNPSYAPVVLAGGECRILGRVVRTTREW